MSVGAAQTSYGFTAEQTDPTGMIYLRARHYSPSLGRFMTRDTWGGSANQPMSYNKWAYTYGNPVNLSDPTGMKPGDDKYCIPLQGNDQLYCAKIVRGLNPLNSMSLTDVHLFDEFVDGKCPLPPLYMVLNIPRGGDKYQSYGFWFHYLRNEKSKRSGGEPVSISTVISNALSGELNVPSLYSSIMPHMVRAMAAKSQWLGTYFVLGSRVMDEVDPYLFLNDGSGSTRILERNWSTGDISGEDMLQEYFANGPNDEPQPGLLAEVEKDLRINFGTNYNNLPTDWGNTTAYTMTLPIYDKLRAKPYDPDKENANVDEVYWRSNPDAGKPNGLGQFFIVTTNQVHKLCAGGFSCVVP